MLQVLIDQSMLTGKPATSINSKCEITINISGLVWNKAVPAFSNGNERNQFVASLFPWDWNSPEKIGIVWLGPDNEKLFMHNLKLLVNDYAAYKPDTAYLQEHYEKILTDKIYTKGDPIKINEPEIAGDFNGDKKTIIEIKDNANTTIINPETKFLSASIAQFSQKLPPNNLDLKLTFFAKDNLEIPAGAKSFFVFPIGADADKIWSSRYKMFSVTENAEQECVDQPPGHNAEPIILFRFSGSEAKIKYIGSNGDDVIMELFCPITPIPEGSKADTPIQLRDKDGNFLGYTTIEVCDSENLVANLSSELSSLFDIPKIIYEFILNKKEGFVKAEATPIAEYCDWIKAVNEYFFASLRDSLDNQFIILTYILTEYDKSNPGTEIKDLIEIISLLDDKIELAIWKNLLLKDEKLKPLIEKLDQLLVDFQAGSIKDFVQDWLKLLSDILALVNSSETQQSIIVQQCSDILINNPKKDQILKDLNTALKTFGDLRKVQFKGLISFAHQFLFRKNLLLEDNVNSLEFSKRVMSCFLAYMKNRAQENSLDFYPQITHDPFNIVPADNSDKVNWAILYDFIKVSYESTIIDCIKKVIKKSTDIPPKVTVRVDTLDTVSSHTDKKDDLSDEIAGHIIAMQRGKTPNTAVDTANPAWKTVNWSRVNLNDRKSNPKKMQPLINDYLIPSFLPESNNIKNTHLSLSNENLSLIAGHDTLEDTVHNKVDETPDFTFSFLFENSINTTTHSIVPAYALWYGYYYNFAGFVALNSGVLPEVLRKDKNDWVTPLIDKNAITNYNEYKHYRRVPIANPSSAVLQIDEKEAIQIPSGLLPIACELPEWHSNQPDGTNNKNDKKTLPVYLLFNNGNKNTKQQNALKIKVRKPLTSFWNWYAWHGEKLASDNPSLKKVMQREFEVRGSNKLHNEYLHDPAVSDNLVIVVEQLFPLKSDNKIEYFSVALKQNTGFPFDSFNDGFVNIEKVAKNDYPESVVLVNKGKGNLIEIPEGYVVKISIHALTKTAYFNGTSKRFHEWMADVIDSKTLIKNDYKDYYLTHPVELLFEAAIKPSLANVTEQQQLWNQMKIPEKTEKNQVMLNLEKNEFRYSYYSRTKVAHQVWHWNGRLSNNLLKLANNNEQNGFPKNINPLFDSSTKKYATNYAMKWEAWEFSDRPDFSALEFTTHLRAFRKSKTLLSEEQTLFTDNRPDDNRALYYRFTTELFGRYELLGGDYAGSLKSAIIVDDVSNPWKRFVKLSRKHADLKLPKPVIRFAIPLTASIDECPKSDEIISASLMVVVNDRWFSELGMAEKFEIGIELLDYKKDKDSKIQYHLNAGSDSILSGKGLEEIDVTGNPVGIEFPVPNLNDDKKENPIAVFSPEGPAGLTFDFATTTPKLIGSTFILKVNDIRKFVKNEDQSKMGPWSMVQIAARRSTYKSFMENDMELKSDWTAKEWVQLLPDTNSMIPMAWKQEHANYGFVKLEADGPNIKAKDFKMPVLKTDVVTDNVKDHYESRTEKYLILSEKVLNAGGQPVETYKATYHYNGSDSFVLNDSLEHNFKPKTIKDGFVRIIMVRVTDKSIHESKSLWEMLFGKNINKSIGFEEVQNDPVAALPLISKRISIKIK